MNGLNQIVILLGFIWCTAGNNFTTPLVVVKYKFCYPNSKHCIECHQNPSYIIFTKPFQQTTYHIQMMDELNRIRSQYAIEHGISNMKFTNWFQGFEALTSQMSVYGTPINNCQVNGTVDSFNYKILDFKSEMQLLRMNETDNAIKQQFPIFLSQFLHHPHMMTFNLDEFGCCYTYTAQNRKLTTLLRCMVYTENRGHNSEFKTGPVCDDCDHTSERCIDLVWYTGLCVYNQFNETRLRLAVKPETDRISISGYKFIIQFMVPGCIYVLNVTVLFLIVYVAYATCVICRHNKKFGIRRFSDTDANEYAMPMIENIYNY